MTSNNLIYDILPTKTGEKLMIRDSSFGSNLVSLIVSKASFRTAGVRVSSPELAM